MMREEGRQGKREKEPLMTGGSSDCAVKAAAACTMSLY